MDRYAQLGLVAAQEAFADAGPRQERADRRHRRQSSEARQVASGSSSKQQRILQERG